MSDTMINPNSPNLLNYLMINKIIVRDYGNLDYIISKNNVKNNMMNLKVCFRSD